MKSFYIFKIGIIVLVITFFILSNLTPLSKETKNFFYLISSPFQKWLWKTGSKISTFFEGISEIKNLKSENEELKLKIQELISEKAALIEIKKENEILREALNLGLEKEFELNLAEIIAKDVPQDYLIINKGSKDGLKIGLPVITQQRVLVGKIGEVYDNFSKIQLITSKDSSFDAKIVEKDSNPPTALPSEAQAPIYGLAKGKGSFKLSLDFVPKEKEIKTADIVVTAVLGGIFPQGLLVGEIQSIKKSDIAPFQTAEVRPAFEVKDLDFLFIIKNFESFEK